ncbi:iron-containing alcohol dehydrogenase family protein [Gracilibacillus marinus]|uniref:Iron-containing alcohol dehydrogenase family protein n=1 Tax=Gracilibacillus marinus TaxID=630535 RepID=A0ABV8VQC3_9BACI
MTQPISNIPIPAILEIRNHALVDLDVILQRNHFQNVYILFDSFTFDHYSQKVKQLLKHTHADCILLDSNVEIHTLVTMSYSIGPYDAMIAIGGGMCIDYGKYIAYLKRIPFISMPTSASNDGFASSNCSLLVNGKKTTVPAKVPYGIIADLEIIKQAPSSLILAGVGDLMSNITALYDWDFEEQHQVAPVNHFAAMLSKKAVNSFIRTPMDDIKQPIFLKELVSSLTMGGIATVISGNSSPISGSEHLISHALDKVSEKPQMHGVQVGVATYLMSMVQTHRSERMRKVFTRTGFFEHVKELGIKRAEFELAITKSYSIKPNRYTYLHEEIYRQQALEISKTDPIMQAILHA